MTTPNNEAAFKCDCSPLYYFYVYNPVNSNLDLKAVCLNAEYNDSTIEYAFIISMVSSNQSTDRNT